MCHTAENVQILRESRADGVNLDTPILFVYSDEGPDHRTNYRSVQLAGLAMLLALDLGHVSGSSDWANAELCQPC